MFPYYFIVPACFSIVCIASGMLTWKFLPFAARVMFVNCICNLAADFIGELMMQYELNNHIVFNALIIVDFLLLLVACHKLLPVRIRRIYVPAFLLLFGSIFSASIYYYGRNHFANMAMVTGSFLISLGYLIALFHAEIAGGDTRAIRLLCLSIIIYYCCSAPLHAAMQYLIEHNKQIPSYVYDISPLLSSIKSLMIAAAFFHFKRAQLYPSVKKAISG